MKTLKNKKDNTTFTGTITAQEGMIVSFETTKVNGQKIEATTYTLSLEDYNEIGETFGMGYDYELNHTTGKVIISDFEAKWESRPLKVYTTEFGTYVNVRGERSYIEMEDYTAYEAYREARA